MVGTRVSERWWIVVLAALSPWAAARVIAIRERTRRWFPAHGPQYELYDTSMLLVALGLLGYVLTTPPPSTQEGLAPLEFISDNQLGWAIVAAGVIGGAFAYSLRTLRVGYIVTITVATVMSANFLVGFLHTWLGEPATEWRLALSAVLYGWIARRLMRDNSE